MYAVIERPPARASQDPAASPACGWLRWGLVPSWAKDASIGNRLINARIETVDEKPAFRKAFASRRCLLPADGYFEWYAPRSPAGKKQPFFIRRRDGGSLAMAGLYEVWRDPARPRTRPGTRCCWTVHGDHDRGRPTTSAGSTTGCRCSSSASAGPTGSTPGPRRTPCWLLTPAPGRLEAYPVSRAVSNVRNNGPELVEPLPLEDVPEELLT